MNRYSSQRKGVKNSGGAVAVSIQDSNKQANTGKDYTHLFRLYLNAPNSTILILALESTYFYVKFRDKKIRLASSRTEPISKGQIITQVSVCLDSECFPCFFSLCHFFLFILHLTTYFITNILQKRSSIQEIKPY